MIKFPFYFRYTVVLLGLILTFYILDVGKFILIPLALSLFFALLLFPFCQKLEHLKLPRSIASIVSMVIILIIIGALVYVLSIQVRDISRELPAIEEKVNELINNGQKFLEERFDIDQSEQTTYLRESFSSFMQNSSTIYQTTFSITAGLLNYIIIVPIALFFMLYYRTFFKDFLYMLFSRQQHDKVGKVIAKAQLVIQNYITGLFTVIAIVAILNSLGLFFLGVDHAVFFGVTAALLTIIPYIGIFFGSLLPILYTFLVEDSILIPLGVAAVFWFIQLLEGNFITPNIVGGKVSLNPFAAIVALLVGGALWGPAGMILFIPFLAMLKVIFDAIEPMRPYGFLLGVPEVRQEEKVYRAWYLKIRSWFKG